MNRTFTDVYREQMIEVLVAFSPGAQKGDQYVINVKVTLECKTPVPIVKICNRGYQSLDEARHAGVAVGRDLVNTLMPQSDELSPGRMNRCV
jgi:anthranilate/para-aminobenzoate synthase component II